MSSKPLFKVSTADLRHKIIIQQQSSDSDGYGEQVDAWTNLITAYAAIEPLESRLDSYEHYTSEQVKPENTSRIKIRYTQGITAKMRVVYGPKTYDILSIINAEERNIWLYLVCRELIL